jgi:hypothetical protein
MRFALDAEGNDYYDDARDIIPSINASVKWLTSVINIAIGQNKAGEEIFRDLSIVGVFQTSKDSRISLNVFPHEPWTIIGVYPIPTTDSTGRTYTPPSNLDASSYRTDLYYVDSEKSCKRLTSEEWNDNRGNPFEAGYIGNASCPELADYAYLAPKNYLSDSSSTIDREIEIRPNLISKLAAVEYVKKPTVVTALTDSIEFPDSLFQMLFNRALKYIGYKQGDGTTLDTVTDKDLQLLINAVS